MAAAKTRHPIDHRREHESNLRSAQQYASQMSWMEDTGRGFQRKDDGRAGASPYPRRKLESWFRYRSLNFPTLSQKQRWQITVHMIEIRKLQISRAAERLARNHCRACRPLAPHRAAYWQISTPSVWPICYCALPAVGPPTPGPDPPPQRGQQRADLCGLGRVGLPLRQVGHEICLFLSPTQSASALQTGIQ